MECEFLKSKTLTAYQINVVKNPNSNNNSQIVCFYRQIIQQLD